MSQTAFVTGGTGFVGSHLVEELLRREINEVRCLVRSEPKWLADLEVTYVHGDLSDIEVLWEALDGVSHVYHVAGLTRAPSWDSFYEVNVQGTLNLMGAIKQAVPSVDRVMVMSSLAAVGQGQEGPATEDTPLQPVSRYGRSKAQMETALKEAHEMNTSYWDALPITVVRPSAVYGPRDRDILDFFRAVKRHLCPVVGGAEEAVSLVHARDLAKGMVEAATSPRTVRDTYFLGSVRPYTWREIKAATTATLDTWALTIPVPRPFVGVAGTVAEAWGWLSGSYPPFNRDKAREIQYACTTCSIEKAHEHFGFHPEIPLDEGVAETIQWYEAKSWL